MSDFALTGIVPPVATPFTDAGEVDFVSLERLIEFLLDAGVHGLFMLGTTSETALLTGAERVAIVETAVRVAAGRVPIMAGTLDTSTNRVIENAMAVRDAGAQAIVVTAPFYLRFSQDEIVAHFHAIKRAIDLPIVAYDIPGTTHSKIEPATMIRLFDDGTIIGLKDSSGEDTAFRGLLIAAETRPGFSVMTGSEQTIDGSLAAGAAGVVPGLGNVDPHGFVRIWNASQAGDFAGAVAAQKQLFKLEPIVRTGNAARLGPHACVLGSYKTALMLRGVIETNAMGRPLTRFDAEDTERVRAILEQAGLL